MCRDHMIELAKTAAKCPRCSLTVLTEDFIDGDVMMATSIDVSKKAQTLDTPGETPQLATNQVLISSTMKKEPIIKLKAVPLDVKVQQ